MKPNIPHARLSLCILAASVLLSPALPATVVVPGQSSPWLAGMPDGTTLGGDSAPAQSPVEVLDIEIIPGQVLRFTASGAVANAPHRDAFGPDGDPNRIATHRDGDAHGLSSCRAPLNALLGVFLGPDRPDSTPAPDTLDFGTEGARNYATLAPRLKQVFFIGDGRTSSGNLQNVVVPPGATRLFLGVMDGFSWRDNLGEHSVTITVLDVPRLTILRHEEGISLRWSRRVPEYMLEYSDDLSAAHWNPVLQTPAIDEEDLVVILPISAERQFFRLRLPD